MKTLPPRSVAATLLALSLGFSISTVLARDDDDREKSNFAARLSGYNEVHFIAGNPLANPVVPPALRGAVSTGASGRFKATIDDNAKMIHYELSYEGLESNVTQAHIHFGQHHTVGGIVVWLCQTTGTPAPAGVSALTPTCPQAGTVTGTITPAQVLAVAGQGIAVEEFEELTRAIRAGTAYANVHSVTFGPGEIRGQLRSRSYHH
jgi:hypothetical protein